ncbi:MAG: DUF366 family protein [Bdellovibrionota bacterium]
MKYKFIAEQINYDGSELKPLYAYVNHKLHGDSIVSFIGSCDVSLKHMVDAEDFVVQAKIKSDKMLHFIVEIFGQNLMTAVSLQRLLVSIVQIMLLEKGHLLKRTGDDLYFGNKKLSVSIASCSTVSSMIHLGLNVGNEGTPVATCALNDFGIEAAQFSKDLMQRFSEEYKSIIEAAQKVRPL